MYLSYQHLIGWLKESSILVKYGNVVSPFFCIINSYFLLTDFQITDDLIFVAILCNNPNVPPIRVHAEPDGEVGGSGGAGMAVPLIGLASSSRHCQCVPAPFHKGNLSCKHTNLLHTFA